MENTELKRFDDELRKRVVSFNLLKSPLETEQTETIDGLYITLSFQFGTYNRKYPAALQPTIRIDTLNPAWFCYHCKSMWDKSIFSSLKRQQINCVIYCSNCVKEWLELHPAQQHRLVEETAAANILLWSQGAADVNS